MKKKAVVWTLVLFAVVAFCLVFPWRTVTHVPSVSITSALGHQISCSVQQMPRWSWIGSAESYSVIWSENSSRSMFIDEWGTNYPLDGSEPLQVLRRIEEARSYVEVFARNGELRLPTWWRAVAYPDAPAAKQAEGR